MKVLFLSNHRKNYNGADQHRIEKLSEGLNKYGVNTKILYMQTEKNSFFHQLLSMILSINEIKKWNPDFIHAYTYISVILLSRLFDSKKIIYDFQGLRSHEILLCPGKLRKIKARFVSYLEMLAVRYAGICVTVSEKLAEILIKRGKSKDGVFIIRNGVDVNLFVPKKRQIYSNIFRVGYAGGFQSWQAIDMLIEASKRLSNHKNLIWRLIGFTEKQKKIKDKINSVNNSNFELYNYCDRNKLVELLGACDVLIIPRDKNRATEVAFPTKFAEYLALGRPIIVNNVDETANFIKQYKCGFVVETPIEFVNLIRTLMYMPKEKLDEIGQKARELALNKFKWENICKEYLDILYFNSQDKYY